MNSIIRNLSDQDTPQPQLSANTSSVVSLDARRGKPAWERDVVSALCRYAELDEGWDSYNGKPLRYDTGMFALKVLSQVMNESTPTPSIVPISSGGVQIEWHHNNLDIELYIAAPYECELSVYDHITNGPQQITSIKADLSPVSQSIEKLVDFNRHIIQNAHAG